MNDLPADFISLITSVHGAAGAQWIKDLPTIIADFEQRWSIKVMPPFSGLSYNFAAPAIKADGSQAVLKLGVPNREMLTEAEALRLYDGHGICRLLEAEPERGAILIERLVPGVMLSTIDDDDEATRIAAGVMRQLWRPVPADHPFPTTAKWSHGLGRLREFYGGGTGPFPQGLVEQSEVLFRDLLASEGEQMLLHGDLHHFNILTAEREPWLAIDPKGVAGEPAYDTGALLRNPDPWIFEQPNLREVMARRISILADELTLDRQRILGWALAQAVLSAWWMVEDNLHGWEPTIMLAEALAAID